ncbi:MAG: glutathionylspermidine synthase family protein [bacterium]|nr:glutathionylspermidine synthase family protein [Candidatus Sumerlaeota bacterium]
MKRRTIKPRPDWRQKVESQGMLFHSPEGETYWDETAYYEFTSREIDELEKTTYDLDKMCLQAVEHIITNNLFERFLIPSEFIPFVKTSWEQDEHTIYGRFDLVYDGAGPPKLLEYNADTPTSLLEAAVIQWQWLQDSLPAIGHDCDQFNSIHERLIEAWTSLRDKVIGRVYFTCIADNLEDYITTSYLRDTAMQAKLDTEYADIGGIGWNPQTREFTAPDSRPMTCIFKLYPWEWMVREDYGPCLIDAGTVWLEPPWKMLLSNKALLVVLSELFPDTPCIPRASFELSAAAASGYVSKPILAREGANITVVRNGITLLDTEGDYADSPRIYQELCLLPNYDGNYPVIGSWMVNGHACGIGIREDKNIVTTNTSRFIPHLFV